MFTKVNKLFTSIVLGLLPFHSIANGDFYVGSKIGWVHGSNACESQRLSCDSDSFGAGIYAGYELSDWLALEVGYDYLGKINATYPALENPNTTALYTGEIEGVEFAIKPYWHLNDNVSLFLNAGTLAWWVDVKGNEISYDHQASSNGWSPLIGLGVSYEISDNISTSLDYKWFNNVGSRDTGGVDLSMVSLGVSYRFGPKYTDPVATPNTLDAIAAPATIVKESITNILFDFDSTVLNPEAINELNVITKRMLDYPQATLKIQAHTDAVGSQDYNMNLSQERADVVRHYFINENIAADRIFIEAKGEDSPVADNNLKSGQKLNRRVILISPEIVIK